MMTRGEFLIQTGGAVGALLGLLYGAVRALPRIRGASVTSGMGRVIGSVLCGVLGWATGFGVFGLLLLHGCAGSLLERLRARQDRDGNV
jgi:hypothetical protein